MARKAATVLDFQRGGRLERFCRRSLEEVTIPKKRTSTVCPRCGSTETIPIRSGWPAPELGQKAPRTGPLGGRILGIDNPDRVCKKCGHQWQTRARI